MGAGGLIQCRLGAPDVRGAHHQDHVRSRAASGSGAGGGRGVHTGEEPAEEYGVHEPGAAVGVLRGDRAAVLVV